MIRITLTIALALMAGACSNKENAVPSQADWSTVRANLAFTCAHEADHLPALDPASDQLFRYGRYLEKKDGPKDYSSVARYYRIAAAHGHYKANNNLQQLVSTGLAPSPNAPSETINLAEQLVAAGIPGGYYDMGHYLELGFGVKQDQEKALRYFRKAADLGSPEAQFYVGDLLSPRDKAPEISRQMTKCATDQGYGKAANYLGIDLSTIKLYSEAVIAFQKGVEAGDTQSAFALENGFDTDPSNALYYIGLANDFERSRRYKLIGKFIDDNDGRNPKVPDIDQIVPLPPAKLPPWDGTFQWQKDQDAAKPPQKPDEQLVQRLAREKNLDPATGLPLAPVKSAKVERVPLGTTVRPGEVCPQDGYWCVRPFDDYRPEATRRFSKGETMPQLAMDNPRSIPGLDALLGMRKYRANRAWTLKSYIDQT
ncbi:SEL1-like repeat protein [Paraburkholderia terrae]|uniref:Sel1 repeat family protein n=1 Tax=Paraburkholderia terrae TaxID=311230 RepID=A0A2I8EUW2_9BURK|nr:sel1 repeat family protein [Paraburkholderia terrae]AUT63051.1 sel1 repeat family protein [Paraburkholderia terrae]